MKIVCLYYIFAYSMQNQLSVHNIIEYIQNLLLYQATGILTNYIYISSY